MPVPNPELLEEKKETVDVIVIGAGIAGLAAASYLQEHGRKVLVLEAEMTAGGRMATVEEDGVPLDIGAQFIDKSYKHILAKSEQLSLETMPINITKAGIQQPDNSVKYFNPTKPKSIFKFEGLTKQEKLKLVAGLPLVMSKPPKVDVYNLSGGLPLDNQSAADYFGKYTGETAVREIFDPVFRGLSFYSMHDTSAGYMKAIAPWLMSLSTMTWKKGIGALTKALSERLVVMYGVRVLAVRRVRPGAEVIALVDGKHYNYEAAKVIMAVPGDRVQDMIIQPTAKEWNFFDVVRYSSAVVVHARSDTHLPEEAGALFYKPDKEQRLAAIHLNPYTHSHEKTYFVITLIGDFARRYMARKVSDVEIQALVVAKLGKMKNFEVLQAYSWGSAVPIFYPGYLAQVATFKAATGSEKRLFFCGDYLGGGSTETAYASGIEAARQALESS